MSGSVGRCEETEESQTAFKTYRVIYRVVNNQVVMYLIVDGRDPVH